MGANYKGSQSLASMNKFDHNGQMVRSHQCTSLALRYMIRQQMKDMKCPDVSMPRYPMDVPRPQEGACAHGVISYSRQFSLLHKDAVVEVQWENILVASPGFFFPLCLSSSIFLDHKKSIYPVHLSPSKIRCNH